MEEKKQIEGGCVHVIFLHKIPSGDEEWHKDLILCCRDEHLFHLTPHCFLCVVMTLKSLFFSSQISVSLHILYNGAHLMKWELNHLRNISGQTQSTAFMAFCYIWLQQQKQMFALFFKKKNKQKLLQLIKFWWGMRMIEVNGANFGWFAIKNVKIIIP